MERGFSMDQDAPVVKSVAEIAARFFGELTAAIPSWESRLKETPDDLEQIENEVHALAARGADMVICGLLSLAVQDPSPRREAGRVACPVQLSFGRGRDRKVKVRLRSGVVVWMCALYCQPKRRLLAMEEEQQAGVHIDGAQFGIANGVSPGLRSRVARQASLCPSLEFAHEELAREGVELDIKAVRRITYQCGEKQLRLRKLLVDQWRAETLDLGDELAGKRVAVQIDGGRTKIRGELRPARKRKPASNEDDLIVEDAPGRSQKRPKREFDADWREPKLVTIFVHDEDGKMDQQYKPTIDGTFLGPDALAELVAMHLHRLGAAKAASLTFCNDGAPWIWDRIPTIIEKAGLQNVPMHEVLDNCHATHHVSLALAALGLSDKQRMPLYREQRTQLRNGRWKQVVADLKELAADQPADSKIHTEIAYLEKHGEAGRLNYVQFVKLGIPRGSGAVESGIRRVINLRLKSNATFWREEKAEIMLQLRAQVISKRWDECSSNIRELLRHDARTNWTWEPSPMSCKDEANLSTGV